jgi:hypothetical protein
VVSPPSHGTTHSGAVAGGGGAAGGGAAAAGGGNGESGLSCASGCAAAGCTAACRRGCRARGSGTAACRTRAHGGSGCGGCCGRAARAAHERARSVGRHPACCTPAPHASAMRAALPLVRAATTRASVSVGGCTEKGRAREEEEDRSR